MYYRIIYVVKKRVFCCVELICVNWFFISFYNLYIYNCIEYIISFVLKLGEIINKILLSFSVKMLLSLVLIGNILKFLGIFIYIDILCVLLIKIYKWKGMFLGS